jgi:hypothetical protein
VKDGASIDNDVLTDVLEADSSIHLMVLKEGEEWGECNL